jgi:ribonuclease HII
MTDDERKRLEALAHYERALWKTGVAHVAGMDEAGRGPLAGPVVSACVVMPERPLVEGVKDSKAIRSEKKREEVYGRIMRHALAVGIGIVPNPQIDETNILAATRKAFLLALSELAVTPGYVLTDHVHGLELPCGHTMLVRGDALSYCVAAASVVAKVTRDRLMREESLRYPQYGFDRHKGYCTREHEEAIAEHGLCPLHRRTFCRRFAYEG